MAQRHHANEVDGQLAAIVCHACKKSAGQGGMARAVNWQGQKALAFTKLANASWLKMAQSGKMSVLPV